MIVKSEFYDTPLQRSDMGQYTEIFFHNIFMANQLGGKTITMPLNFQGKELLQNSYPLHCQRHNHLPSTGELPLGFYLKTKYT